MKHIRLVIFFACVSINAFNQNTHTNVKMITLPAKPTPIEISAANTAVIVVDMQNDFGSKGGMFDRGGFDMSMIKKVVGPTAKALAAARKSGIKIIYLKMGFLPDLSDLGKEDAPNRVRHLQAGVGNTITAPDGSKSRILIRDTWNTEIIPELKPEPNDMVIYKHRFSGFYETELDDILKKAGIKNLIFTGWTTSVCVESTVRDAMFRDYSPIVLQDCTAEPLGKDLPRSNYDATLLIIETGLGWITNSDEFIKSIKEKDVAVH